jgi:nucleotide-binding universal stress UspA family protein
MRTILLATDGSESSRRALAFSIELALETGASLEVVSVGAAVPMRGTDELAEAERIATAAAGQATAAGVDARGSAAHGDIVACVIDAAVALDAELLVVGARGLGSVSGAMLGSVSQALVRRSPVPVTVVHQPAAHTASVVGA